MWWHDVGDRASLWTMIARMLSRGMSRAATCSRAAPKAANRTVNAVDERLRGSPAL